MNNNKITQLELDFSVIKDGTKVRVKGYDCHHLLDLTDTIGVVDSYSQRTGDYFIYFKGMRGIVPNTRLILIYRREQLQVIPGRRGRCSWEHLVKKKSN
ncbi:hypothetical protein [Fischerella thermalis]|uniref:hypothetical protein n=1 Tax=Fischerella thermalis TaxID=372787 RepID=UPI0019DEE63A|nr:hypothetical protein [Fischerella thermalis]MBF1990842.1 hypothetical protein [Fischerella thermalis M58_A2018_009]MBF2061264.1 hypothetical protein [Fischerella thermalis M66_A2018_004]